MSELLPELIFEVDDGAIYWIAAKSPQHARELWLNYNIEQMGYSDEYEVLQELSEGEPKIKLITLVKSVDYKLVSDSESVNCTHCGGTGKKSKVNSLLEVLHKFYKNPKKFDYNILGCSEY